MIHTYNDLPCVHTKVIDIFYSIEYVSGKAMMILRIFLVIVRQLSSKLYICMIYWMEPYMKIPGKKIHLDALNQNANES